MVFQQNTDLQKRQHIRVATNSQKGINWRIQKVLKYILNEALVLKTYYRLYTLCKAGQEFKQLLNP